MQKPTYPTNVLENQKLSTETKFVYNQFFYLVMFSYWFAFGLSELNLNLVYIWNKQNLVEHILNKFSMYSIMVAIFFQTLKTLDL